MSATRPRPKTAPAAREVVVLGTGGTIAGGGARGSNLNYTSGTVPVERLFKGVEVPAGLQIRTEQIAQLDSKDMDAATWHALAQRCQQLLAEPEVGGVVITHGTDTLEESAFFLQAVLPAHRHKPVVLSCAMRPATAASPDGPRNLADALAVAATPGALGVMVVCAGEIHDPRHVRKEHPYRLNAFGSGDAGVVGYVEEARVRLLKPWPCAPARRWPANLLGRLGEASTWPRVEIVMSHAGAGPGLIDSLLHERQQGAPGAVAGIVLAATGNGTVHHSLEQAALRAQAAGVAVLRATRCAQGCIVGPAQEALPHAADLSPVKARIELMLTLALDRWRQG